MTRGHDKKCPRCSRVLPRTSFPLRKLGKATVAGPRSLLEVLRLPHLLITQRITDVTKTAKAAAAA